MILSRLEQSQALISASSRSELSAKKVDDGAQDLGLVLEMAVDGGVAEAHAFGDTLDGQRFQALVGDDVQGGGDDLFLPGRDFLHVHLQLVNVH